MVLPRSVIWLGDWLAFSSLIPAGIAASLLAAASRAMGVTPDPASVALAAAGTLVVYNVDRLRDVAADRVASPLRTAFIERHRRVMVGLTAGAVLAAAGLALQVRPTTWLVCGVVLGVGLVHRRLKGHRTLKMAYMTAAWLAVTVGIPALSTPGSAQRFSWIAFIYGCAIGSNLIASELRGPLPSRREEASLWVARGLAAVGAAGAGLGPPGLDALSVVPLCGLLSLIAFRPSERFGLVVVDGALLLGGTLALCL